MVWIEGGPAQGLGVCKESTLLNVLWAMLAYSSTAHLKPGLLLGLAHRKFGA